MDSPTELTTAGPEKQDVTPRGRIHRRFALSVVAALVVLGAILGALLRPEPPSAAALSPDDYHRRTKRFAIFRDARQWMTRYSPKLFSFAPVMISTSFLDIEAVDSLRVLDKLSRATYSTNTLRVWILPSNEVAAVCRDLQAIPGVDAPDSPRISTSEGIACGLSVYGPAVFKNGSGFATRSLDVHPKLSSGSVDLGVIVRSTVAMTNSQGTTLLHTNLNTSFRVRLRRTEGAIVIDPSDHTSSTSTILSIWAHSPSAK